MDEVIVTCRILVRVHKYYDSMNFLEEETRHISLDGRHSYPFSKNPLDLCCEWVGVRSSFDGEEDYKDNAYEFVNYFVVGKKACVRE